MNEILSEIDFDTIIDLLSSQENIVWVQNREGIKIFFESDVVIQLLFDEDKLVNLSLGYPYEYFNQSLFNQFKSFEQILHFCSNLKCIQTQECFICNSLFPSGRGSMSVSQDIFLQLDNIDLDMLTLIREQGLEQYTISKQLVQLNYMQQEIQPSKTIKEVQKQFDQVLNNISLSPNRVMNFKLCDKFFITNNGQIAMYHSDCMLLLQG